MTTTFQGHVRSIACAAPAKVLVTLATPMDPAGGHDITLLIPEAEAKNWLPGAMVGFTIRPLHSHERA